MIDTHFANRRLSIRRGLRNQTELGWDFSKKAREHALVTAMATESSTTSLIIFGGDVGSFRGPGENAHSDSGTAGAWACDLNFDLRATQTIQCRCSSALSPRKEALSIPDDLHTTLVGDPGADPSTSCNLSQRRCADPVCGPQPKLRADRVACAAQNASDWISRTTSTA